MMNSKRLGPGEKINIYTSNFTLAKLNITGTRTSICCIVFIPVECCNNGSCSNFCSTFCKYTCLWCSYAGYITNGIHIWKLCQQVSPVNRDPSIFRHAALQHYIWCNMFWNTEEQIEWHF